MLVHINLSTLPSIYNFIPPPNARTFSATWLLLSVSKMLYSKHGECLFSRTRSFLSYYSLPFPISYPGFTFILNFLINKVFSSRAWIQSKGIEAYSEINWIISFSYHIILEDSDESVCEYFNSIFRIKAGIFELRGFSHSIIQSNRFGSFQWRADIQENYIFYQTKPSWGE